MGLDTMVSEMKKRAATAPAFGNSIKFDFGNDGCIVLDGTNGSNQISTVNTATDCTINIKKSDFEGMLDGSVNPMMAFMMGKIKVDGDMSVAMKLQSIIG